MSPPLRFIAKYERGPDLNSEFHQYVDDLSCCLFNKYNLSNIYPEKFQIVYNRKIRKPFARYDATNDILFLNLPRHLYDYSQVRAKIWLMLNDSILNHINKILVRIDDEYREALCCFIAQKYCKYVNLTTADINQVLDISPERDLLLKQMRNLHRYHLFFEFLIKELSIISSNGKVEDCVETIIQIVKDFTRPRYRSTYFYEKNDGTKCCLIKIGTFSAILRKLQKGKTRDEIIAPYVEKIEEVKKTGGYVIIVSEHNYTYDWARYVIANYLDYLSEDDVIHLKEKRIMYGLLKFPKPNLT